MNCEVPLAIGNQGIPKPHLTANLTLTTCLGGGNSGPVVSGAEQQQGTEQKAG